MRLRGSNLGLFVKIADAPLVARGIQGLADFVPGDFTLPQNPVSLSGLSDFVKARYSVPQNPVRLSGLGCGSGCSCGPCKGGMGATSSTGVMATIQNEWVSLQSNSILGIPGGYALIAGGVIVLFVLPMVLKKGRRR